MSYVDLYSMVHTEEILAHFASLHFRPPLTVHKPKEKIIGRFRINLITIRNTARLWNGQ